MKVLNLLNKFLKLPEGWDYGVGVPVTKLSADKAILIFSSINGFEFDISPMTNGGCVLICYIGDDFFDIEIDNQGNIINFTHEKGIGCNYEILFELDYPTIENIVEILNKFKNK